ncbi:MAG TPA: hypothetical protein VM681_00735 [Candidatus Thermoplasmatota archaeon]|nr:hypothetical protein [Candidatus Thermoplasmatota archaeon]
MRTLVVVAAAKDDLAAPRRKLGYDRLALVAPEGRGRALASALGEEATVLEVPPDDVLGCLRAMEGLLAGLPDSTRVAVDGGTGAMSLGAVLACLSRGVEAWFLEHKPVCLPVLRAMPVAGRFGGDELAVLAALDGRRAHGDLARRAGLPLARARAAMLSLRRHGALGSDATQAWPTDLGSYYRKALVEKPD